jgi:two-component system, sensor histidine kinase and response regulator
MTAAIDKADEVSPQSRTAVSSKLLHDLRSPLNQIIGYSEMLAEEAAGRSGSLQTDLASIRGAGKRLLHVIEQNFEENIDLESIPATLEQSVPGPAPEARSPIAPGRLLVVDDEEVNRDVLSRRLERQGHEVFTAGSGQEAIRMLRESEYDAVLLDIMMPDMDGYEVLRVLKADEALRHTPVIMISALSEVQSVVHCIEAGAEDYLAKPFNPTLLKARLGACLEKKRSRDRESALFARLEENYARLQEVEKLRDDMRNMIVHDLRTPLTSVITGVQLLEQKGGLSDEQRELTAIAIGGGRTLLTMINDLLDVEKLEAGGMQLNRDEVLVPLLVERAAAQVRTLARDRGVELHTEVDRSIPVICGDEAKLTRTLVNLLGNAIKFTPSGSVTLSVSPGAAGRIRFAVRDTGVGIPAEAFERIFEKFGQVEAGGSSGTGLGLAFCKLAVEAHGGRMTVESTPGIGSIFSFSIPVIGSREQ